MRWTKKPHEHEWMPNASWGADVGTFMTWDSCHCGDFRVTHVKAGPGWWVAANVAHLQMMRRIRERMR